MAAFRANSISENTSLRGRTKEDMKKNKGYWIGKRLTAPGNGRQDKRATGRSQRTSEFGGKGSHFRGVVGGEEIFQNVADRNFR